MKPGDFPIGSPESRAAARAMIESRDKDVPRLQIINDSVQISGQDNSLPHVGDWYPMTDGAFVRFVYIPPGTDEETERRILDTP